MSVEVRVIRSANRKKTISATLNHGVLIVRIPKNLSKREEMSWVERMKARLTGRVERRRQRSSDDLQARCEDLNRRYFGGRLRFNVRWVSNMNSRWGSCTPTTQEIRISHELNRMPDWVLDYVLVHELAHLLIADHSPQFWELVHRYPQTDRAIGYLMGYAHAKNQSEVPTAC